MLNTDPPTFLETAALIFSCVWMLFIALEDFRKFRISNRSVLILLGLYFIYALAGGFGDISSDLAAGGVLFGLGFVFWLTGLMGAGDAKLYLPVGLLVGWLSLFSFTIYLLIFSLLLLVLFRFPIPLPFRHILLLHRLDEIRQNEKLPYGLPITFSAIAVLLPRALGT